MKKLCIVCLILCLAASLAGAEGLRFTPGTYEGTARGNNDMVSVSVTLTENAIADIQIGEQHETFYIFRNPARVIPQEILDAQSLDVDLVGGATMSSRAIVNAVADACKKANAEGDLYQKAPVSQTDREETCQVLVVGGGLAGLNAAVKLRTMGIHVILVEQLGLTGGNCLFAGGNFFGPMAEEDIEACRTAWMKQTALYTEVTPRDGLPNTEKVDKLLRDSVDFVRYCEKELGFDMCLTTEYANSSAADVTKYMIRPDAEYEPYSRRGSQICIALEDKYLELGGDLRLGTRATELIQDADGAIRGAVCQTPEGQLTIHADAVIMATGSITQNNDMLKTYIPYRAEDWFCTSVGSTGEGLQMMLDKGAVMWDTWVTGTIVVHDQPILTRTTKNGIQVSGSKSKSALHLNRLGKRVAKEDHAREGNFYGIEGATDVLIEVMDAPLAAEVGRLEEFEQKASDHGPFFKADTLAELGEKMGFAPEAFEQEVARYNGFCAAGEDKDFGKAPEYLLAIDEGPFYAVVDTLVGYDITGGVKTDLRARVLREDGTAIPGLYAAGLASSRDYFSTAYVGGASMTICATVAITAAEDAVEHCVR